MQNAPMPDTPEDDQPPVPTDLDAAPPSRKTSGAGLARPVQEHLGRELRTAYHAMADKPAFLGDPALPVHVERHLQRIEAREKAHDRGVKAVESALQEIELFGVEDDASTPDKKGQKEEP
jgi:hypothetical protein